jgi:2-polyprenyl-3-methyl-5-hydroxy-6-metoxy-1,4-benzoquinol methylase
MSHATEFLPELYDGIAPGYYDKVYRRGRGVQWFWHDARFREVEARLPKTLDSILDLGCGPGTFLGRLERPVRRAIGVDLANAQVEYARHTYQRDGLEFLAADVRDLPATDRFSAVVSIEVIEHLPREATQSFLRTLFERLSPGGTAILTTPNYRSLWPLLEHLVSWIGAVDYRRQHINRFTAHRLAAEMTAAGFETVDVGTFFVFSPFLASLSTVAARKARLLERALKRAGAELIVSGVRPRASGDGGVRRAFC